MAELKFTTSPGSRPTPTRPTPNNSPARSRRSAAKWWHSASPSSRSRASKDHGPRGNRGLSVAQARRDWFASPAYRKIAPLRQKSAHTRAFSVEGLPGSAAS
ncbi:MAG: hypothetical protein WDO13_09855 [Verrucomicrobiota bacterium]